MCENAENAEKKLKEYRVLNTENYKEGKREPAKNKVYRKIRRFDRKFQGGRPSKTGVRLRRYSRTISPPGLLLGYRFWADWSLCAPCWV